MNFKCYGIILAILFGLLGCQSVPVAQQKSDSNKDIDWLDQAQSAESYESFSVSLHNLIEAKDARKLLTLLSDSTDFSNKWPNTSGLMPEDHKSIWQLAHKFGYMLPGLGDSDWYFLSGNYVQEGSYYKLSYRVSIEGSYTWVSFYIHNRNNKFYIHRIRNEYYSIWLSDYLENVDEVLAAVVERSSSKSKRNKATSMTLSKALNQVLDSWLFEYDDFKGYLDSLKLSYYRPFVLSVLFDSLAYSPNTNDERWKELSWWLESRREHALEKLEFIEHPFQMFYFNLNDQKSDEAIRSSINEIKTATGSSAWALTYWASLELEEGDTDKALDLLKESIANYPLYDDAYFVLMDLHNSQSDFAKINQLLNFLTEKFAYEITTEYFENRPEYAEYLESDYFKEWKS